MVSDVSPARPVKPGYVVTYPNREKQSSKVTKLTVMLVLVLSTALAGLAGGLFAYYHISYYPAHAFSPAWTLGTVACTSVIGRPWVGAMVLTRSRSIR